MIGPDGEEDYSNQIFVYRPPSPRPWQSHGSEIEVEEVKVENKRKLIRLKCSRKRKFFAQPVKYQSFQKQDDSQDLKPDEDRSEPTHKVIFISNFPNRFFFF